MQAKKEEVKRKLKERRVPSSAIGRVAGFAQLGASLVYGTMADSVGPRHLTIEFTFMSIKDSRNNNLILDCVAMGIWSCNLAM